MGRLRRYIRWADSRQDLDPLGQIPSVPPVRLGVGYFSSGTRIASPRRRDQRRNADHRQKVLQHLLGDVIKACKTVSTCSAYSDRQAKGSLASGHLDDVNYRIDDLLRVRPRGVERHGKAFRDFVRRSIGGGSGFLGHILPLLRYRRGVSARLYNDGVDALAGELVVVGLQAANRARSVRQLSFCIPTWLIISSRFRSFPPGQGDRKAAQRLAKNVMKSSNL